jgi:hypothetical protein
VLLVDLRCHGESAAAAGAPPVPGPHTVDAAARDVLELLRERRMFPQMLIGHSFGGKVRCGGACCGGGGAAGRAPATVRRRRRGACCCCCGGGGCGGSGSGGARKGRKTSRRRAAPAPASRLNLPYAPPPPLPLPLPLLPKKVVMSMARQFGVASLPRPVQVWVLDALPGEVRAGGGAGGAADHPSKLISTLQSLPTPLASRAELIDHLSARGFSLPVARWMTTNLKPAGSNAGSNGQSGLDWAFDLDGIADMYRSYEATCLWDLLRSPPQGLKLDFVKATRSTFRWEGHDEAEIAAMGHGVHPLDAGHWVHSENPGAARARGGGGGRGPAARPAGRRAGGCRGWRALHAPSGARY